MYESQYLWLLRAEIMYERRNYGSLEPKWFILLCYLKVLKIVFPINLKFNLLLRSNFFITITVLL